MNSQHSASNVATHRLCGITLAAAMLLSTVGCANMSPSARATAIGATTGAVAGGVLTGTTTGAAVGAAVGGVIGNEVHKDRKR